MPAFDCDQSSNFLSLPSLLAAIVDSSDDAIVSKNLNSIVTSWNKGAERIFGYLAEEMVGQSIMQIIPLERADEEPRILARLQRGERVDHFETVRVRKDGRKIDVSLTISPLKDLSGKVVGASKIARDITGQKEIQRKLATANEQLRKADTLKAEFISTLSHELRTPLTSIIGWIQILKEGVEPDEMTEALEVIERNIRVQSQLINDLLDMSRIEAGKMNLDVRRIDLPPVVNAAIDCVRPAATAKLIKLTTAISSIDGVMMGDADRLQQVLWNILTNAVKFTPKDGRIHVTVERIDSHVEIIVNDSGIGIPAEFIDHIFERFRQADASLTRRHTGLGLGLAIAKQLVELHGGTIHAKSEGTNHGATFIVKLPLLPIQVDIRHNDSNPREGADSESDPGGDLRGIRVLVVDDDWDSLRVVQRILVKRGAEVEIADSQDLALRNFSKTEPHVLLSDISMPGHDGYELIAQVRKLPNGHKVPAVALTALARPEDRTRALRAGFQMHIAKPVDASELAAVVKNLATLRLGN